MTTILCPECAQGKPGNCAGLALDPDTDELVPCANAPEHDCGFCGECTG